jgi:hypothetical protein
MSAKQIPVIAAVFVAMILVGPEIARAQHLDVLAEQINGQLVTGTADFDSSQWLLGLRAFHRDLSAGTNGLQGNNPGFNAIGAGSADMPAGAQALPAFSDLSWDFLPMTIGGVSRNLFYWNGLNQAGMPGTSPSDVTWGPPPTPLYTLSLFDKSNAKYSVNGTNTFVPGGVIDTTASDGFIHRHRFFFIEDNDGNSATQPADGLYLIALRLRMAGLRPSLPVLMVFGTPNSAVAAEDDAAFPWVEQATQLPGDYNGDGVVNAADYTVWRDTLGQSASSGLWADGSGNGIVDQADYDLWKTHFGQTAQITFPTISGGGASGRLGTSGVPEPTSLKLAASVFLIGIALRFSWPRRGNRVLNALSPLSMEHKWAD